MRLSVAALLFTLPFAASSAMACCVIEADPNGITALALDGKVLEFADSADRRMLITGFVYEVSELWSGNSITIGSATLGVEADYGATLDLSRPSTLTYLGFDTEGLPGVAMFEGTDYEMGPRGGSLQLTEILPQPGGYRIRGEFSGQICPEDDTALPCQNLQGRFAFDAETLPAAALTGNLMSAAR